MYEFLEDKYQKLEEVDELFYINMLMFKEFREMEVCNF